MQSYLQELMIGKNQSAPTLDRIRQSLKNLQEDNAKLQKELCIYEQKISQLPIEIRHRIHHQQYLPSQQHEVFSNARQTAEKQQQQQASSSPSPNPFTSRVDQNLLQLKLKNLESQQSQIDHISKLSDMFIRCQRGQQTKSKDDRSGQEMQELQEIAQFIESIQPYGLESGPQTNYSLEQYSLVNDLISNLKLHTSKKLTQKCQNLIHYAPSGNHEKIIIQKFLIQNCKSIILASNQNSNANNTTSAQSQKDLKIINKFIEKILEEVIYYDVSCQKIAMMQVIPNNQISQTNTHHQVINRKKVYFLPSDTQKHFDSINFTLSFHIDKINQLRSILMSDQSKQFGQMFDKQVERHVSLIKSNLEYVLPYINIKSRKIIMSVIANGKDQVIEFEDLVLRLKFKGQDGDMFMNNLDAVFGRLLEISDKEDDNDEQEQIRFNDKNFQTLTSFFGLGIFQAQQSLLQTSSKAIKKLTTNFTARNNFQKPNSSSKLTSKKLFNMIFFSVSNLIERFDDLFDKQGQKFGRYSRILGKTYDEKANEWVDKLIQVREGVRKRIHEE